MNPINNIIDNLNNDRYQVVYEATWYGDFFLFVKDRELDLELAIDITNSDKALFEQQPLKIVTYVKSLKDRIICRSIS